MDNMTLKMSYDQGKFIFLVSVPLEEGKKEFEFVLDTMQAEQFSSDLIRLIRDVNLQQARDYQRRLENGEI